MAEIEYIKTSTGGAIIVVPPSELENLKTALTRATNTWQDPPVEIVDLNDRLHEREYWIGTGMKPTLDRQYIKIPNDIALKRPVEASDDL